VLQKPIVQVCTFSNTHHIGDLTGAEATDETPRFVKASFRKAGEKSLYAIAELAYYIVVRETWKPPRGVDKTKANAITLRR
jgi:hypothetical protein